MLVIFETVADRVRGRSAGKSWPCRCTGKGWSVWGKERAVGFSAQR